MKKLFVCLCATVLLAGCGAGGSKESEKVTKTCSVEESGMKMDVKLDAEGDAITEIGMFALMPYEALDVTAEEAKEVFTEDNLKLIESTMLSTLDVTEEEVNPTTKLGDTGIEVNLSLKVSDFEKTFNATTLEEGIKELEGQGYTCK